MKSLRWLHLVNQMVQFALTDWLVGCGPLLLLFLSQGNLVEIVSISKIRASLGVVIRTAVLA